MLRKTALGPLFIILILVSPLFGQPWAEKMFETTSHDFGSVARDAKTEFRFVFTNIYLEDVHVAGVRTSCGCTTPRVENPLLKTYEKGAIVAHLNTDRFTGHKGATITVTFDKPARATVQLHVSSFIRDDVVFEPGSVQFGTVEQGAAAQKKVTVRRQGKNDWKILDISSSNPHLSVSMGETKRGRGEVAYELVVRLDKDAPPGLINDCLTLATNDRSSPQVPLAVEGVVEAGIVVSPSSLFLGVVQPGKTVTKQLVVRGKRPFRILSVSSEGRSFQFDTSAESAPKPLHLVPVTFVAGDEPGTVLDKIRIQTDLAEATPELSAYAVVSQ